MESKKTTAPAPKKRATKVTYNLFKSLSNFQNECPPIFEGSQAYGYKYADLPSILKVVNPILHKYNLGFTQLVIDQGIKTVLFHTETGETLEAYVEIPDAELRGQNLYQAKGSSYTYFRRYQLSAILGVCSDADNDAQGQTVKKETPKHTPTAPSTPKKDEKRGPYKPKLSVMQFNKLVTAIKNGKTDKEGNVINEAYALKNYDLDEIQVRTIKTLK